MIFALNIRWGTSLLARTKNDQNLLNPSNARKPMGYFKHTQKMLSLSRMFAALNLVESMDIRHFQNINKFPSNTMASSYYQACTISMKKGIFPISDSYNTYKNLACVFN